MEAYEIGPQLGDLVGDHHGTFGRPGGHNVLVGQRCRGDDLARSLGREKFLEKRARIQVLDHEPQAVVMMILVRRGRSRDKRQQGNGEKRRHFEKPPSSDRCAESFAHR